MDINSVMSEVWLGNTEQRVGNSAQTEVNKIAQRQLPLGWGLENAIQEENFFFFFPQNKLHWWNHYIMMTRTCLEKWKNSVCPEYRMCNAGKFSPYIESNEEFLAVTKLTKSDFFGRRIWSLCVPMVTMNYVRSIRLNQEASGCK